MRKSAQRVKRKIRVRKKIKGTHQKPRLSVFRSNNYIYAQIVDDEKQVTLFGFSEKYLPKTKGEKGTKSQNAKELGLLIAKKAKDKKITKIVFDRGGYSYHGRVKALAEGAREGGLEF